MAFVSEENILRFEVPVNDSLLMNIQAALNDLLHDGVGVFFWELAFASKQIEQSTALAILSDDHESAAFFFFDEFQHLRML